MYYQNKFNVIYKYTTFRYSVYMYKTIVIIDVMNFGTRAGDNLFFNLELEHVLDVWKEI